MKQSVRKIIPILFLVFLAAFAVISLLSKRHAPIDQWSSQLVSEKITWVELSKGYGVEQFSYTISEHDYDELIEILKTITEKNSSRREKERRLEDGYRLAFFYEDKLWLFKCCEDQIVSLMFEDKETGTYYGCEGKLLYIDSPALWNYIKNTIDTNVNK